MASNSRSARGLVKIVGKLTKLVDKNGQNCPRENSYVAELFELIHCFSTAEYLYIALPAPTSMIFADYKKKKCPAPFFPVFILLLPPYPF